VAYLSRGKKLVAQSGSISLTLTRLAFLYGLFCPSAVFLSRLEVKVIHKSIQILGRCNFLPSQIHLFVTAIPREDLPFAWLRAPRPTDRSL
jgi:hypothetical protein